jgi:hypothetical protein
MTEATASGMRIRIVKGPIALHSAVDKGPDLMHAGGYVWVGERVLARKGATRTILLSIDFTG